MTAGAGGRAGRVRAGTPSSAGAEQHSVARWASAPPHTLAPVAGPLVVLGAPRSSQTLVAFALGQHPEVDMVLDTTWLPRLGPALNDVHATASRLGDRTALAAARATRSDLLSTVGAAVADLLAGASSGTWVSSGTVASTADVAWLLELFPAARIVHVVRHPDAAVSSLAGQACGDGRYASQETGYRAWAASVAALVEAERVYGSHRVTRVDVTDLHEDPRRTLTRCLALLGLSYDRRCASALHAITQVPPGAPTGQLAGTSPHGRSSAVHLHAEVTRAGPREPGDAVAAAAVLTESAPSHALSRRASDPSGDAHRRYQQFVALAVPAGETVAVVSKGDPGLLEVSGRRCWHLPRTADGRYTGYHPADSGAALTYLREAVRDGARWLVVPGATAWWLKYYGGFAEHLRATAPCVAHHDDLAAVYALHTGDDQR